MEGEERGERYLLDDELERSVGGQVQSVEGDLRRLDAPLQRTRVVALRRGDLLLRQRAPPELVRPPRLGDAFVRDLRVRPDGRAVTVEEGPVTLRVTPVSRDSPPRWVEETYIPCLGAVMRLCDVVVPFAMPLEEQHLVLHPAAARLIQMVDVALEPLPLRPPTLGIERLVGGIRAVDQPQVDLRLSPGQPPILATCRGSRRWVRVRSRTSRDPSRGHPGGRTPPPSCIGCASAVLRPRHLARGAFSPFLGPGS